MKESFVLLIWVFLIDGVFGVDEMKTVSVMEGDSLTLHTAVTGLQNDRTNFIKWYFKGIRVAQIYGDLSMFCTDVKCAGDYNERFRDRLKLNNQTGALTIMNISITDSGDYILRTIINNINDRKIFTVTVQPVSDIKTPDRYSSDQQTPDRFSSDQQTPDSGLSSAAVAGICVAVVLVVAVTAGVIYSRCKISRRGQNDMEMQHNVQDVKEQQINLMNGAGQEKRGCH